VKPWKKSNLKAALYHEELRHFGLSLFSKSMLEGITSQWIQFGLNEKVFGTTLERDLGSDERVQTLRGLLLLFMSLSKLKNENTRLIPCLIRSFTNNDTMHIASINLFPHEFVEAG